MLSDEQRQTLLRIAREALIATVEGRPLPDIHTDDQLLNNQCGAFVTLHKLGELRGCIGFPEPRTSLLMSVQQAASKAAKEDFRFECVHMDEIPFITIDISVLSLFEEIQSINDIVIGKHGLFLSAGPLRGLLLPQVAVEYHWDTETFVQNTARKAGLPAGEWKIPGASLFVFTAEVFHEELFPSVAR